MHEIISFLGILAPFFLLIAIFTGYLLARQSLKPIDLMVAQVKSFRAPSLRERLSVLNPDDELGNLAQVINALLDRIEHAFEQLKRFTSDASHELRTPLTVMRSVGEVGLQAGRPACEYREVIGSMLEENNRLTRLIDCLLFLSKADSEALTLSIEAFDVAELLRESRDILAVLAEEKKQTVRMRTPETLVVQADKTLLRRAVLNLIDNAIKYTPVGGEITISASSNTMIRITVQDTGPGIPAECREKIFDRFFRLADDRSRETGGAGLGLSIVQWIVSAHRGVVRIEDPGHGSLFIIEIPATQQQSISPSSIPGHGISS